MVEASRKAVLRAARKSARVSVAKAGGLAGVSASTLKRWESGRGLPGLRELRSYLSLLGHDEGSAFHQSLDSTCGQGIEEGRRVWRPVLRVLRSRRRRLGITLEDVAGVTGLSLASVHRFETGERLPNEDTLLQLCNACGLRPREAAELRSVLYEGRAVDQDAIQRFMAPHQDPHVAVFALLDRGQKEVAAVQQLLTSFMLMGDQATFAEVWPHLRGFLPSESSAWPVSVRTSLAVLSSLCTARPVVADRLMRLRTSVLSEPCAFVRANCALDLARLSVSSGEPLVAQDWLEVASLAAKRSGSEHLSYLVELNSCSMRAQELRCATALDEVASLAERAVSPVHRYVADVATAQTAFVIGDFQTMSWAVRSGAQAESDYGLGSPLLRRVAGHLNAADSN